MYDAWCEEYRKSCVCDIEMLSCFDAFKDEYDYVRKHNKRSNTCSSLGAEANNTKKKYSGGVLWCCSLEIFNEKLAEGQRNNGLTVVVFTAHWTQPCELMDPILSDVSCKMREVNFLQVNMVEKYYKPFAEKWEVEAVPTFIIFKNGEVVDKFVVFVKEELLQLKGVFGNKPHKKMKRIGLNSFKRIQ